MHTDGDLEFEITFFEKLVSDHPNYVDALRPLAEAYTRRGDYEKGLEIDARLVKLLPDDPIARYNLACSFALIEKKEEAFASLEAAVRMGYREFEHLKKDPDLNILHDDPRFQALIRTGSKRKASDSSSLQ